MKLNSLPVRASSLAAGLRGAILHAGYKLKIAFVAFNTSVSICIWAEAYKLV